MGKKMDQIEKDIQDDVGEVEKDLSQFTHLVISAFRDGFRRAGRAWTRAEQTVAIADLTNEQVAAIRAEPNLSVKPIVLALAPKVPAANNSAAAQ